MIRQACQQLLVLCAALLYIDVHASPLFDSEDVIEVSISGPFGKLLADPESLESMPFLLRTGGRDFEIDVRIRGHSRRRVCDFPPLRLDFSDTEVAKSVFAGQRKLKLVTHCRNYDRGEQDMLEEYLAYKVLNLLTDASYRVRPLHIAYDDTDDELPEKARSRYGFVLESSREFADRTGAMPVTLPGVPAKRHDIDNAALVYVFQYLVANTDWALTKADYDEGCCHNIDLFEQQRQIVLVPYDFDLVGLVNAQYAFPDPLLRIDKVTTRMYRGLCTDRETLRAAIRHIKNKQQVILDTIENTPGLSVENVVTANRFLGAFFERAGNEDKLIRTFERRCVD